MSQRFISTKEKTEDKKRKLRLIGALTIVIAAMVCFAAVFSHVSESSEAEELKQLTEALNRSVAHCYSVEGCYPESLEYIKEHYGLTYDEDSFFVDYRPVAENVMPDITIIEKGGDN
ncbi:MAG: hypothetical protein PUJ11_01670 [Eubacteriaceae bacterium]|nr:hypothetical protein [Eubacteriaceae bacterium]